MNNTKKCHYNQLYEPSCDETECIVPLNYFVFTVNSDKNMVDIVP